MKINEKILTFMVCILSVTTICLAGLYFFKYINIDVMFLFLGLTQIFGGIHQINLAKQINQNGINKGNSTVGISSIIVGAVIIAFSIFKMLGRV